MIYEAKMLHIILGQRIAGFNTLEYKRERSLLSFYSDLGPKAGEAC